MTTSIDSNVLATLWDEKDPLNFRISELLGEISQTSRLVLSGVVYAELLAAPNRTSDMLDYFCHRTGIGVEWQLGEQVLRLAGKAFGTYIGRRRRSHSELPRRILADFIIGAHADVNGYALLTLDQRLYRAAFPKLAIVTV